MFYKFSVSVSKLHHLAWCAMLVLTLAACGADNTSSMPSQSTTTMGQAGGDFFVNGVPPRTSVRVGAMYKYVPAATPNAYGRVLSYQITNKPEWATFGEMTGELSGIPNTGDVGTSAEIQIGVSDGTQQATIGPFRIIVTPEPTTTGPQPPPPGTPTIAGTPAATVTAGQLYSFVPTVTDPSGEALSFSIVNRPAWATFNPATGALSGTPTTASVGNFTNILISVSTSGAPVSLAAFSIQVQASADGAPTISGTPAATVAAGGNYSFTPTAGDPDGNALSFSILNAPSWATFSTKTGELTGTAPSGASPRLFSNIVISVSDGTLSASLAPFSIDVQATTGGGGGGHAIKFHPGHYIELDPGSGGGGLAGWLATIASLRGAPNVTGVVLWQPWSALEFAQGVYSSGSGANAQGFAAVDQILAACKAAGLQFILAYEDRSFGGNVSANAGSEGQLPPYLDTIENGSPGYIDAPAGTTFQGAGLQLIADVLNPAVWAREIALGQAYLSRYDSDPNFEMWSSPETANGQFTSAGQYDAYVGQYKLWMAAMRAAGPHTGIRICANFMDNQGELSSLFNAALPYGIAMGGPDTYPNFATMPTPENGNFSGESNLVFNGELGGTDYRGVLPWVSEVQTPEEGGNRGSIPQIYAFAMGGNPLTGGSMGPGYFFWSFDAGYMGSNAFTNSQILAFIPSVNGAVNSKVPSSY
jgi:hypothetical protein